jgi:hypothetical protein
MPQGAEIETIRAAVQAFCKVDELSPRPFAFS